MKLHSLYFIYFFFLKINMNKYSLKDITLVNKNKESNKVLNLKINNTNLFYIFQ